MTSATPKPDPEVVLSRLKDFQRRTVEHVFDRMYEADEPTRRFLVADEVGLGKTLVARGVIAKVVEHLWQQRSINIIYICSSGDIARQNVQRLNVSSDVEFKSPDRITLLPQHVEDLKKNKLNFIALTPGTSFDLKNATGLKEERVLLYWMLKSIWQLDGVAPKNVLQVGVDRKSFRDQIKRFDRDRSISRGLKSAFRAALTDDNAARRERGQSTLKVRFNRVCRELPKSQEWKRIPEETRSEIRSVIGELRALLAETCIRALSPDLIILDEFQRFRSLLEGEDDAGLLAEKLFEWKDARVLLLSATPYKMYTRGLDAGEDDHYRDFLKTINFLLSDANAAAKIDKTLREFRRSLYQLTEGDGQKVEEHRSSLESQLRDVMVRTERMAVSATGDAMLKEVRSSIPVTKEDIESYLETGRLITWLESVNGGQSTDQTEYWKSAPFLLNFMEQYKLKQSFDTTADDLRRGSRAAKELARQLLACRHSLLSTDVMENYESIDPANSRLRKLASETLECDGAELWKLLWLPPSAPYHELAGPFAATGLRQFTKRLIFSSWKVVPKAISVLLSYEAERQMFQSFDSEARNTSADRERRARLLDFSRSQGRLSGMPVLGLVYPCSFFATYCDPLELAKPALGEGQRPALSTVLGEARTAIDKALRKLTGNRPDTGPADADWYWVAPILLDLEKWPNEIGEWLEYASLAEDWRGPYIPRREGTADTAWTDHVKRAVELANNASQLGRPPDDLVDVMALAAIGGPATAALRALVRMCEGEQLATNMDVRDAAGAIGWALRYQFNLPDVIAMIRGINRAEPYWRRVLEYCCDGCLQSVLDEYLHVQRDAQSLAGKAPEATVKALAATLTEAVTIRVSQPHIDDIHASKDGAIKIQPHVTRSRFAMRFGDDHAEQESSRLRKEHVRAAFNSPFWPFVLATTSIGQEGLDFHQYCHAVVHWNLPCNPVDLEQREGRVHRYKGHAVRKNVARRHAAAISNSRRDEDHWTYLFEAARNARPTEHDLIPYWLYSIENGAMIERHLPMLPLSKENSMVPDLKRSLAVYRMVFGQPRQDDLLEYLSQKFTPEQIAENFEKLRIDLTPPIRQST
ncbi:MAG: hypothetical protein KDA91_11120 [Planctomycetaceae bacterium]|nr:hypothetical protein [Planctomycetaceae bacterium]